MISKFRFSLIAVILLVLLGFGFQNQASGQVGENAQFCPFVEVPDGWLEVADIFPTSPLSFTAGLIGTVEGIGGNVVGGMDWMHVDFTPFEAPTPTNQDGAQIVTWWTQKSDRNTFVQLTNGGFDFQWVHVRLLDESCEEIRNFCDFYTPGDTHVYDFGDLITNDGLTPDENVLQGHEGFLTITAVDDCPSPDRAVDYNFLNATVQIVSALDYSYGFNAYHRRALCEDQEVFVNRIENGSFQEGVLGPWDKEQGCAGVIESDGTNPPFNIPDCDDPQNPDCDDPNADLFQSWIASSDDNNTPTSDLPDDDSCPTTPYGFDSPDDSVAWHLRSNQLIDQGQETNVSVVESNVFTPEFGDPGLGSGVAYDLRFLGGNTSQCDNYALVCVIDVTNFDPDAPNGAFFEDCDCYNTTGHGNGPADVGEDDDCIELQTNDDEDVVLQNLIFEGGASSLNSGVLTGLEEGRSYVVQYITGQINGEESDCDDNNDDTGALVDNFRFIGIDLIECDGILTGEINAFLSNHLPEELAGQFNTIVDDAAAADAVVFNFADEYSPEYRTLAAFITAEVGIFDDLEEFQSCGDAEVCFARLGIDADLPVSEEFNTPTPTGTTAPPTTPPTIGPPTTAPPTTGGGGGGGGSCAIAGSPVQLGTAFANVLIPLVPVAFAFGVRAVRRRKK